MVRVKFEVFIQQQQQTGDFPQRFNSRRRREEDIDQINVDDMFDEIIQNVCITFEVFMINTGIEPGSSSSHPISLITLLAHNFGL